MLLNPHLKSLNYPNTKDLFLWVLSDTSIKRFQTFQAQQSQVEGCADTGAKSGWLVAQTYNFQNRK